MSSGPYVFSQHVILVGGFSGSDYLFEQVSQALLAKGFTVVRPDNHVCVCLLSNFCFMSLSIVLWFRSKAVSDGAISFYLDHFVRTRVSKFAYGQFCTLAFNPMDPEHLCRTQEMFKAYSGERRIRGYFDIILAKVSPNPE